MLNGHFRVGASQSLPPRPAGFDAPAYHEGANPGVVTMLPIKVDKGQDPRLR